MSNHFKDSGIVILRQEMLSFRLKLVLQLLLVMLAKSKTYSKWNSMS